MAGKIDSLVQNSYLLALMSNWSQILIDKQISWNSYKIETLCHFVPTGTLLRIYRSLTQPYITYGIAVSGQTAQKNLDKLLIWQKRALRLIHFLYTDLTWSRYSTCIASSRLTFNTASQFVLLSMTFLTIVCRKIVLTSFLNLHKWIASILRFQRPVDFKFNIPGQIFYNVNFLVLVQEFGTVFLKVSEYFLDTNLRLLLNTLEWKDTYVGTPTLINILSKMTRNTKYVCIFGNIVF